MCVWGGGLFDGWKLSALFVYAAPTGYLSDHTPPSQETPRGLIQECPLMLLPPPLFYFLQRGEGLEGVWAEDNERREGKAEEEGLRVEVES